MNNLIAPALGSPKGKIHLHGSSTEAGIRQTIKSSSLPVIFDEFETTGELSKIRVQNLVELLRVSWSASQGKIVKGSAGGNAVEFELAFPALVSSVRVNLDNDADRSRFSVLELKPHGNDTVRWREVERLMSMIDSDYGDSLFARSTRLVNVIRESQKVLGTVLAGRVSQRYGQQVGTLLAGFWSLEHDTPISESESVNLINELDLKYEIEDSKLTDEQECLHHLLTWKLSFRKPNGDLSETTIERILQSNTYVTEYELDGLKNYGLVLKQKVLWVSNAHAELEKIYGKTRWANQWSRSLIRLPDAKKTTIGSGGRGGQVVKAIKLDLV
jgi:putative DNA primase/helicase